jgi:hypothetical protein
MYGGPYHGPNNRYIDHPLERPGRRVEVLPNNESVFHDMVGRRGTLVRKNGGGGNNPSYLVYFDHYIDLNAPAYILRFLPDIENNEDEDHLFIRRNNRE